MKLLPDGFEGIGSDRKSGQTIASIVTYPDWLLDRFSLGRAYWEIYGLWAVVVLLGSAIAAGCTKSWWVFFGGITAYAAAGVVLGFCIRHLERWNSRWRSMRKLRERAQRIRETLAAFQLHCGLYREWHREVTLNLSPENSERAERYYDLLDHARRILEGAILRSLFLEEQVRNGYALLDAGSPPPNLTLQLEGIDVSAARVLPTEDTFDPAQAFRYEETMERVFDELNGVRALPEKAR